MSEQEKQIFAENLRQLRARTGMTQKDFAKKAGITPATLSAYEAGQKSPAVHIAAQIAKIYGSSLDWLCGISTGKDDTNQPPDMQTILKDLAFLMRDVPGLRYDEYFDHCEQKNKASIEIIDPDIQKYFQTVRSLITLNLEGTLDDDMFQACIESASKKAVDACNAIPCFDDDTVPF